MTTPAIDVHGLRKIYRSKLGGKPIAALDGIDLTVMRGELFGLLGPNGAGKTTTVKILLGLTHATDGDAQLLGRPVAEPESRRKVGYLPEGHRFPGYLTARQTLSVFGQMSGVDSGTIRQRTASLLARVKLTEWADVKVKKFSKGMTQRLGLAAALVHEPDLLLLDEPTDGVDPVGRREIRDLLREEASRGKTILLNSHLLSEIELTCDRVAMLRRGKVAAAGRIADLTATGSRYRLGFSPFLPETVDVLRETGAIVDLLNGGATVEVTTRDLAHLNTLIDRIRERGGVLSEVSPLKSSLEDIFVDMVKADSSLGASPVAVTEVVH